MRTKQREEKGTKQKRNSQSRITINIIYFTSLDIIENLTGAVMEIQKLKTGIKRCAYPDPCQQYKDKQINIIITY